MTVATSLHDLTTVDLPEGEYDGLRVERFDIGSGIEHRLESLRLGGRATRPGTYTKLTLNGRLWMSDTDAEKRDHYEVVRRIRNMQARRVVINGLGLGMVLKAALAFEHVEHVDVVELDARVVHLVGGWYSQDPRVVVHHADAYEQARGWPAGTRWDVGWSDIWPDLCTDNLAAMATLRRSYGRRCTWHDCWGRNLLVSHRAQEQRRGW